MTASDTGDQQAAATSPHDTVRPLLRARQVREFTDTPLTPDELAAITDVARWSGSSRNSQPWRFIASTDRALIKTVAEAGGHQTRSLHTATAFVAIVLPDDPDMTRSLAFDDGRAAERILIAAGMLGLGGGVCIVRVDVAATVNGILGIPEGWVVKTIVSLGHPSEEAQKPKSAPGAARRPVDEMVFPERWRD